MRAGEGEENDMITIVGLIDKVIINYNDEVILGEVKKNVNLLMKGRNLFNYLFSKIFISKSLFQFFPVTKNVFLPIWNAIPF